jgi:hypothetical protein
VGWNWAALVGMCVLAAIHVIGGRMRGTRAWERRGALSLAAGISVAYVFIHLLPDLADAERAWEQTRGSARLEWLDQQVYIAALIGLLAADGLQRLGSGGRHRIARCALQESSLVIYNLIIGYYAVRLRHPLAVVMATVAFGAHFLIDDHELDEAYGRFHRRYGRQLLAAAILLGWLLGSTLRVRPTVLVAGFSLVAGGMLLHSLREELDATGERRFVAFICGALGYTGLLIGMFYAIKR